VPQLVPEATKPLSSQLADVPAHLSWFVHSVPESPQFCVFGANTSVGHVVVEPPHVSATSQTGPAARHTKLPALWFG
jgi:hypothetical protein